ncbi:MAG: VWA domain-containing protein [Acidobacteria bacterium]|nr:VWA domain-containing protein [Acidobacteriota bacterium]
MCRFAVLVIIALLTGITVPAAQQPTGAPPPQAVFRAVTELVEVDVTVLDGRRQPVRDLTADDFTILEDGELRPVETFTRVDLADRVTTTAAPWMVEVPSDVASNQITTEEGRLVVILMDRSIPVGHPTAVAREVAAAAVNELGPGDMAALVSTSGGVPQNFTTDKARLMRAINQRDWSTGTSAEAREISTNLLAETPGLVEPLDGRCLCGLCSLETITRVAEALEDLPRRRKSLLFVGASLTLQAGPDVQQLEIDCGRKLEDARRVMFGALDRSGLTIHSIDPTGLQTVGPTSQASSTQRGARVRGAQVQAVETQLQQQGEISVLPDRTGGRTVMNTNGPQTRVPEIVRESQSYYLLGFRPADGNDPGRPRRIEVRVNRRGVRVHARREFVVADGDATPVVADASPAAGALGGLLPSADVPMDVSVAAFAPVDGGNRAVVTVSAGVTAFAPVTGREAGDESIELVTAAYDQAGRSVAVARQTIPLSWPDTAVVPRRVDALSRLDLPPGDYEIRVATSRVDDPRAASVFTFVTVPPFASALLSLSNIVLGATSGTSSAPPDFLDTVLPLRPTPQRTFRRVDQSTAFVRVYQGTSRTDEPEPVHVRVRIVDARDRDVRDEVLVLQPSAFVVGRTADLRMPLPLASLATGDYLLRLEAATGTHVAGRAIRFSVE